MRIKRVVVDDARLPVRHWTHNEPSRRFQRTNSCPRHHMATQCCRRRCWRSRQHGRRWRQQCCDRHRKPWTRSSRQWRTRDLRSCVLANDSSLDFISDNEIDNDVKISSDNFKQNSFIKADPWQPYHNPKIRPTRFTQTRAINLMTPPNHSLPTLCPGKHTISPWNKTQEKSKRKPWSPGVL